MFAGQQESKRAAAENEGQGKQVPVARLGTALASRTVIFYRSAVG